MRLRVAVALLLLAVISAGVLVTRELRSSDATTGGVCRPVAAGWRGQVSGMRLAPTSPGLERSVLAAVNAYRVAHGRSRLVRSMRLTWAARYHSWDMRNRGQLAHERVGESFTQRFARYSPSSCVAENIAQGYTTAPGVVGAWQDSPGHRHVMLLRWVRRAGVGVAGRYVTFDASS